MTKTHATKSALLFSGLALLLCVSMLVGSTFAWFTDTATSAGNKIVAGTLDVKLLMWDGTDYIDISENSDPIFGEGSIAQDNNAETLWEPGKTQVAYLAIENKGSLDLKYAVALNVENVAKDLYKAMEYTIILDATNENAVTAEQLTSANDVIVGMQSVSTADTALNKGETHFFALAIHMKEEAGNEYQAGQVNFDLTVLATQLASENDSFDNTYDENATYDTIVRTVADLKAALANGGSAVLMNDLAVDADDTIVVPAGIATNLNLGGHTLSGVSDAAGSNRNMLDVRGTLNLSNGAVTLTHTGANMGWSNSTNVINITAGGVVNLENAEIRNLGGSDMAIGIHLNNWGEVTLNANNSTIFSPYCAVRVFNSGYDMNNVTITNSELLAGRKALWVHNYTAADFGNDADKAAAADARLNMNMLIDNPVAGVEADDRSNLNDAANNTIVGDIEYGFTDEQVYYKTAASTVANDSDSLEEAVANGADTVYLSTGEYSLPSLAGKEGITIIGTEDTVIGGESVSNGFGGNFGKNTTIKNVTFLGTSTGARWTYAQGGTIVFENCAFLGNDRGGFHIDESNGATLIFNNCTLSGFNAFAGDLVKVVLNGCTLPNNGKYNGLNMYCDLELNDCKFEFTGKGIEFVDFEAAGKTLTITNCTATMNGVAMDLADMIGGTYVSETTITIDGVSVVK